MLAMPPPVQWLGSGFHSIQDGGEAVIQLWYPDAFRAHTQTAKGIDCKDVQEWLLSRLGDLYGLSLFYSIYLCDTQYTKASSGT